MRQMKEQQDRNRAAESRRNREIASLKKDQRRAEVNDVLLFYASSIQTHLSISKLLRSVQSGSKVVFVKTLVPAEADGSPEETTRSDAPQED